MSPQSPMNPSYQPAPGTEYTPQPQYGQYPPQQQQGYPPQQQEYPQQGYPPQQQGYAATPNYAQPGVQHVVHHGASPPAQVIVVQQVKEKKQDGVAPIIIFIVGWFFCPVWCAGWFYVTKKHTRTARIFGALSGGCAILNLIWIVIVIAVVVSAAKSVSDSVNNAYGVYGYSPVYNGNLGAYGYYSYYYNSAAQRTH